jgi:hypothetical protein
MRTLAIIGSCAVASLLFFLLPAYRQAIRVSLEPLYCATDCDCFHPGRAELKPIARQAEQERDAEGIAFVAARLWDDIPESSRLAEEAVHLDPKLTWLYAVVPGRASSGPETDRWVRDLQKYDPQNALPYFIIAAKINSELFRTKRIIPRLHEEPSAWQNAMAAAFQSPKFDNYCSQLKVLEHKVTLRYSFDDPSRRSDCRGLWTPNGDTATYASSVLESAEALEAQGERKAAREKYLAVARFGQMLGSGRGFLMNRVVESAYKHLGALSEEEGNHDQAVLHAYLVDQTGRAERDDEIAREKRGGGDVTRWNAFLARTSALSLLVSVGLLLVCFVVVIVRARSQPLDSFRLGHLPRILGFCGSIGLLLSSAILYAIYKPYGDVFRRFIYTGDESGMSDFRTFVTLAEIPFPSRNDERFWLVVIAFCVTALFVVLTRSLIKHLRATASP